MPLTHHYLRFSSRNYVRKYYFGKMNVLTKKGIIQLILLVFFILLYQYGPFRPQPIASPIRISSYSSSSAPFDVADVFVVTRIVDGDTIVVEGDKKVRMIGVNTPETVDPRRSVQCFGKEASDFTKKLLEGKKVRLEKDVSETDKYGRLLRFVYLIGDDGRELFVNYELVAQGYARVSTFPPDVSRVDQFLLAEKNARDAKRGLWNACPQL